MLRRHQILLGFLLATAIWAVVATLQSDASIYYQICETNQNNNQESCTSHHVLYVIAWYIGYWFNAAAAVITAVATGFIAWFTWTLRQSTDNLWKASTKQIELSRDEFIATHRPKIIVHAVEFKHNPPETENGYYAGASLLCFNIGESVAKNVEVRGEIFGGGAFAVDVQRPLVKSVAELKGGEKLRVEITSDWLASQVAASYRDGQYSHCLGWISYWDDSGLRRETGFCLIADFHPSFGDRWVSAKRREYEYEY